MLNNLSVEVWRNLNIEKFQGKLESKNNVEKNQQFEYKKIYREIRL